MPRPLRSFEPGGFYHLTVTTRSGEVSRPMQLLNSAHSRRFNVRYGRTGHLFSSRFRATTIVDDDHYERARNYVLDKPVTAGIVARREDWPWSSAVRTGS
jgi:putative transposase